VRNADNLPRSRAVVTKSGNLNFVEPSGHLRACNGTAFNELHIRCNYLQGSSLQCQADQSRTELYVSVVVLYRSKAAHLLWPRQLYSNCHASVSASRGRRQSPGQHLPSTELLLSKGAPAIN